MCVGELVDPRPRVVNLLCCTGTDRDIHLVKFATDGRQRKLMIISWVPNSSM